MDPLEVGELLAVWLAVGDTEALGVLVTDAVTLEVLEAEEVTVCVLLSLPEELALGDSDPLEVKVAVPEALGVSLEV